MKSLYESIMQSREPSCKIGESILRKSGVGLPANIKKVEYLKGQHHFWGDADSYSDVEIDVTSSKWTKVVFDDDRHGWKDVVAYFCPESEWILYYKIEGKSYSHNPVLRWSAGAPPTNKSKIEIKDFANFYDDILLKGATVPEFNEVDTDLK